MIKLIVSILIFVSVCECGFEKNSLGARSSGMSCALTADIGDVWSIAVNPAGIAGIDNFKFACSYTPQIFGIRELSIQSLVGYVPVSFGVFGGLIQSSGLKMYKEITATISYGAKLSDLSFGLNLNYYHLSIERYGSDATVGCDAGINIPLSQKIECGLSIRNINSPTIGKTKEKLPQSISVGVNYKPFDNLQIVFDAFKEISFDPSLRTGLEYWLIDAFAVRAGMIECPIQYSAGFGVRISIFQIDYASSRHIDLGWTHTFSLSFF
ncbi:MAG: hypothetical protein HZB59_12700 [Ignavibacteriales bacterium]|nr:hypothetical protein [Ignavibacteriales bacterium]